jgi:hypothetical protein
MPQHVLSWDVPPFLVSSLPQLALEDDGPFHYLERPARNRAQLHGLGGLYRHEASWANMGQRAPATVVLMAFTATCIL